VLQNPRCADLDGVPSLPAAAYALLRTKFRPTTSTLSAAAESKDRTTTKLLIRLQVTVYLLASDQIWMLGAAIWSFQP
jgi:hypothetical protein